MIDSKLNFAKLNFDYLTLSLFIRENIDFLSGARIQKIQQPTRQELILSLRNQGESRKLYVNINPRFFHVCFMGGDAEKRRMLEIPKQPPMFCMLLRKYLEGAKIAKVEQPENERILEFYFETYNELSEKIYICLSIELMERHSNVVLYNYDTNVIIGCMHNVGAEKSSVREIIGGLPYAYPPKSMNKNFSGFSALLKDDVSVNETIDNYFSHMQEAEKIKALQSRLLTVTKTKLRKINSALEKVQKQTPIKEKAEQYRKNGDLIMAGANVEKNKDFSSEIEVFDWETNSNVKIKLDETKTLIENANQYYKLYKKSKTAILKSEEMSGEFEKEKEYIEQVLYTIENALEIADLLEIQEEISSPLNSQSVRHAEHVSASNQRSKLDRSRNKFGMTDNLLKTNISGFKIYIGKNNKQNDYIISKLSRDEDLWFHVHNCAGSHVLLRVEAGQKVDDKIIFECAKLAKEYSVAKNSSKVGVIYTRRKFIKKPPGANLGYVTYKNEKEIIVD